MNVFTVAPAHELHYLLAGEARYSFSALKEPPAEVFPSLVPRLIIKQEKCVFLQFPSTKRNKE
jgi:hypothetical protein